MSLAMLALSSSAAPAPVGPASASLMAMNESESSWHTEGFCELGKCWPSIFVLGTQKGATTSLWDALVNDKKACGAELASTPLADCSACNNKETHFFVGPRRPDGSLMTVQGRDWAHKTLRWDDYISAFQEERARKRGCGVFMEATPSLQHVDSAKRMAEFIPQILQPKIKMVAILREPISRDLSWYNHQLDDYDMGITIGGKTGLAHGGIQKPPEYGKYVANERASFMSCVEQAGGDVKEGAKTCHAANGDPLSGLVWGMYGIQLMRFRTYWPRNQLFVIQMESLIEHTQMHMGSMYKFLGISGTPPAALPEANAHDSPHKVVSIPCSIKTSLEGIFAPFNADLYLQLKGDKHRGDRPAEEPDFPEFTSDVPCH